MTIRAQTAAATRQALVDTAAALLDRGGAGTVTLRDVGSGAGVSRTAAYRHFADKNDLLMAVAAEAWTTLATRLDAIAADAALGPEDALREALGAVLQVARARPHLYRLMFAPANGDAAAAVRAAGAAQDVFLDIVGRLVEGDSAPTAGMLVAAMHGVADLELGGHLSTAKWHVDGDGMIDLLVHTIRGR